jgi:hypothetical protein
MPQAAIAPLDPDNTNGTELATKLVAFEQAVLSNFEGGNPPSNIRWGQTWLQTGLATPWTWRLGFYDGVQTLECFLIDPTQHLIRLDPNEIYVSRAGTHAAIVVNQSEANASLESRYDIFKNGSIVGSLAWSQSWLRSNNGALFLRLKSEDGIYRNRIVIDQDTNFRVFDAGGSDVFRVELGGIMKSGNHAFLTANDSHVLQRDVAEGGVGREILQLFGENSFSGIRFNHVAGTDGSAFACGLRIRKNSVNSRSINAGGTVNTNGADYAEYMRKTRPDTTIAKGELIGVDSDGKITQFYDEAHSFAIKSTDPSYVGSDGWWEDLLPEGTAIPQQDPEKWRLPEYQKASQEFEQMVDGLRYHVDRVAFAGRVPLNITDPEAKFSPGQIIVPEKTNDGRIGWHAKSPKDATLLDTLMSPGRIWAIGKDGRPIVAVKTG